MRIILAGLPLKLRARIIGELRQAEVVSVKSSEALLECLAEKPTAALVLHENLTPRPILDFLSEVRATFAGLLLLVIKTHHHALELHTMVRSDQVNQFFQDPAPAEEIIKTLALELGLQLLPDTPEPKSESLIEVWHESLPVIGQWLDRLDKALNPQQPDFSEARRAAHYLVGNLGTFGLPKGTLLAREAEQLLQRVCDGGVLDLERLERVVEALRSLTIAAHPGMRPNRKVVVVAEAGDFLDQMDMEARLLQWEVEFCDNLLELPLKLAQPQARVVVVDTQAATCKGNPEALDDLLNDPYPTVALAREGQSAPASKPHCRWLERPASAYSVMLAALRSQLAPALDNPPCILVVDDDQISLRVIQRALSQVDFHVEALLSPLEFWDRLESSQPDLVILDIELPNLSGIELCRAVRLDDRYCTIPVLFLSSYADSKTVRKAYEAGADDYMYKPVQPEDLRTRVSNRLERCQQRHRVSRARPASGRTYTTLDQLMLRALREDVPLALAVVTMVDSCDKDWTQCVQRLRANLRGEDLVKPLANQEILVALLSSNSRGTQRRLCNSLGDNCEVGLAWFPEEGRDVEALLDLARGRRQIC